MAFYGGQKVVCVDDSPSFFGDPSGLLKDKIYTIFKIVEYDGVLLFEVDCIRNGHEYRGFKPERFRPVVNKKTDISVFKKAPAPNKQKELV